MADFPKHKRISGDEYFIINIIIVDSQLLDCYFDCFYWLSCVIQVHECVVHIVRHIIVNNFYSVSCHRFLPKFLLKQEQFTPRPSAWTAPPTTPAPTSRRPSTTPTKCLRDATYLNSLAYGYDLDNPPQPDRTAFVTRQCAHRNGWVFIPELKLVPRN